MKLSPNELYDAAEAQLGDKIAPEEMLAAEPYARRKLSIINEMGNTDYEDDYLAILIAEIVNQNRFSRFTLRLYDLVHGDENDSGQDDGIKKEPRPKARPLPDMHILSHPEPKVNRSVR